MAIDHYENFPVASVLLPKRLRYPISVIYRFARTADDFADEGIRTDDQRLDLLDGYMMELDRIERGQPSNTPLFAELARVIEQYKLPIPLFRDLLDAFSQDVVKKRYGTFVELMEYCRRSADPVGRLLLHLFGETDERKMLMSDAICSSLQLINFWQDIAIDWQKGRVYLPQEDLARFDVSEAQIADGDTSGRWRELVQFQIDRTRCILDSGTPLGLALPGRMGLEIRMIVAGGTVILDKLDKDSDVFNNRPVLKPLDWLKMIYQAIRAPLARPTGSQA